MGAEQLTIGENDEGKLINLDLNELESGLNILGIIIDEEGVIVIDKLKAKHIEIGSQETPNGITLYDDDTGNPYCIRMKGGQLITEPGKCMTEIYNEPQVSAPTILNPEPISEPEPTTTTTGTSTESTATSTEPTTTTTTESVATSTESELEQEVESCEESINYYLDADGDGYGNPEVSTLTCSQPVSYITDNTDCDDSKVSIYPGAQEVCNGLDNSCNGEVDEGCDCGITQCDSSINLFGQCDNSCMGELGCSTCEPSCGCAEGFNDCDNDLSNGCEIAGVCVVEETVPEPVIELVDGEE